MIDNWKMSLQIGSHIFTVFFIFNGEYICRTQPGGICL